MLSIHSSVNRNQYLREKRKTIRKRSIRGNVSSDKEWSHQSRFSQFDTNAKEGETILHTNYKVLVK